MFGLLKKLSESGSIKFTMFGIVFVACLNSTNAAASDDMGRQLDAEYRARVERMEREIDRDTEQIRQAQREQERRNATPYYPTPQYGCGPKCDPYLYPERRRYRY